MITKDEALENSSVTQTIVLENFSTLAVKNASFMMALVDFKAKPIRQGSNNVEKRLVKG